ncbi:MAG: SAM-dependent methyltransferase [Bacteroidetes bacterium GWF2_38_335]|nr:MAG: SAM-dependent methyltransferase [Bacteroidetes bacterium GWF2_38_335]HBS85823.1 SAM-dependent methyltransferase [Bacteroidales bacterium]
MKLAISIVTRFVPRHHLHRVSHFFLSVIGLFYEGNTITDPIDGSTYRKLLPYGRLQSRKNALAPYSMSLERHRLLWLYFKEKTNFFTSNIRFLHIAPEYCFIRKFKAMKNLDYVTADLISPWADVKLDVQNIPFKENEFDVIMCNHVLEHVDDDRKAMSEFFRVMKPGGWGIFQVPINYDSEVTAEDKSVTDPRERERLYWQDDHLRLYGKDYGKILASAGFDVVEDDFVKKMDPALAEKYALPLNEIIYLCKKPAGN